MGLGNSAPTGTCMAGYYCKGSATKPNPTDGTTGAICPVGSFCPSNSSNYTQCPSGTYNDKIGASSPSDCLTCPAGAVCNGTG
jgi:hypothetical protein